LLYLGLGSLILPEPLPKPQQSELNSNTQPANPAAPDAPRAVAYDDVESAFILGLQQAEIRVRVEQTRGSLEAARSAAERLHKRIVSLQTSDTGRRLATPDAARKMDFLSRISVPKNFVDIQQVVIGIERSMNSTRQPIEEFGQLVAELSEAEFDLESSNRHCGAVGVAVDKLLDNNVATQPVTLQESIEQLQHADSLAEKEQVDAKLADQRRLHTAQLEDESERITALKKEIEQARLRHDVMLQQSSDTLDVSRR
jgi:hypothetical protein